MIHVECSRCGAIVELWSEDGGSWHAAHHQEHDVEVSLPLGWRVRRIGQNYVIHCPEHAAEPLEEQEAEQ